jgi:hypothetical protein
MSKYKCKFGYAELRSLGCNMKFPYPVPTSVVRQVEGNPEAKKKAFHYWVSDAL